MCWVNTLISTSPPPPLTLMTDEGIQGYIGIQLYYKSIEGFGKPRHLTCFFPSHRKFHITIYRKFARLCAEIRTIFYFAVGGGATKVSVFRGELSMEILGCSEPWFYGYLGVRNSGFTVLWLVRYLGVRIPGFTVPLDLRILSATRIFGLSTED